VGPWQFIQATGSRYGITINWWLDERRNLTKSTGAAVKYLRDLYKEFGSWYLVAASYNMGETGLRKQVEIPKRIKAWWFVAETGKVCFSVKYGSKTLELAKGKPSVQVESAEDLVKALTAIKSAVEAGELDSQIEDASNTLRKGFSK
jgi:hypothetical protein